MRKEKFSLPPMSNGRPIQGENIELLLLGNAL